MLFKSFAMVDKTNEVINALKVLLRGSYFTKYTYGITYFEAELINEALSITTNLIISDFELEDRNEWNKWITSYPFNQYNPCGPEEPARGFLMTLLTQIAIHDIEEENRGTVILHFQNNLRVRIKGEVDIADISWSLQFNNEQGQEIGNCQCSFNELYLSLSESLSNKINSATGKTQA
jgi:hypothetical protein